MKKISPILLFLLASVSAQVSSDEGEVKWFSDVKGYGFIAADDGSEDLFLHHSEIKGGNKDLQEGQKVFYTAKDVGGSLRQAINVVPY